MSTTKTARAASGGGGDATVAERSAPERHARSGRLSSALPGNRANRAALKVPDFDKEEFKAGWSEILERERKALTPDMLEITQPRAKLDPIAEEARELLCAVLIEIDESGDDEDALEEVLKKLPRDEASREKGGKRKESRGKEKFLKKAKAMEEALREKVVEKGLAAEIKKVTDRLNARYMTDGRRSALSATYIYLLDKLFDEKDDEELERLFKDDLGVATKVMLDLEAKGGPLDVYAYLIVDAVMKRNFIRESVTLKRLVSQQVRAAI